MTDAAVAKIEDRRDELEELAAGGGPAAWVAEALLAAAENDAEVATG